MALLPKKANTADNNETMGDRTPIPAGTYPMVITRSEIKPTKAKNGHYLSLQFRIIDGPHKGRVTFANLNIDNPSKVAEEIATKELNTICKALGKVGVEDSVELHDQPMLVTIKIDKNTNSDYPDSNSIVGYKSIEISESSDNNQTESEPAESKKKKLPWEK